MCDLAEQYAKMGIVTSAAELFEEIELWDEVVECYHRAGKENKTEQVVWKYLLESETLRMWAALGDITKDPIHYERALEVEAETEYQVEAEVEHEVKDKVEYQVEAEVEYQVEAEVKHKIEQEVEIEVEAEENDSGDKVQNENYFDSIEINNNMVDDTKISTTTEMNTNTNEDLEEEMRQKRWTTVVRRIRMGIVTVVASAVVALTTFVLWVMNIQQVQS